MRAIVLLTAWVLSVVASRPVDAQGMYSFQFKWGSFGSGDGQFNAPTAVAVDASGNIIVADLNNSRVQVFDDAGNFLFKFGSRCLTSGFGCVDPDGAGPLEVGDGQFNSPRGVAIGTLDRIVVTDAERHRVQVFDAAGNFLFKFGSFGTGTGQFIFPQHVAVDNSGRIIVAEQSNFRVQVFDDAGNSLFTIGGLNNPFGVAVDSNDRIIVSEQLGHRIRVFDAAGIPLFSFGGFGTSDGQFNVPLGVAVDSSDNIIVADAGNHRLQIFDSTGTFLAKFGTFGEADGQFKAPIAVGVDGSNRIIVADAGNNRIQVFTSVISVTIDIKPGSFPNSINPRNKGVVPVAILTTDSFDANTVDPTTVLFGATGTEAAPVHSALEDIDGEGDTDLILHFNTQATGIQCGNTSASLTGKTFGGQMIEGSDSVRTVGCK